MARIIASDGSETTDLSRIQQRLAGIGITLRSWPAPQSERAQTLLNQKALNDAEKEELLKSVDNRFDELKRDKGYISFCGHGTRVEFRNMRIKELK